MGGLASVFNAGTAHVALLVTPRFALLSLMQITGSCCLLCWSCSSASCLLPWAVAILLIPWTYVGKLDWLQASHTQDGCGDSDQSMAPVHRAKALQLDGKAMAAWYKTVAQLHADISGWTARHSKHIQVLVNPPELPPAVAHSVQSGGLIWTELSLCQPVLSKKPTVTTMLLLMHRGNMGRHALQCNETIQTPHQPQIYQELWSVLLGAGSLSADDAADLPGGGQHLQAQYRHPHRDAHPPAQSALPPPLYAAVMTQAAAVCLHPAGPEPFDSLAQIRSIET